MNFLEILIVISIVFKSFFFKLYNKMQYINFNFKNNY